MQHSDHAAATPHANRLSETNRSLAAVRALSVFAAISSSTADLLSITTTVAPSLHRYRLQQHPASASRPASAVLSIQKSTGVVGADSLPISLHAAAAAAVARGRRGQAQRQDRSCGRPRAAWIQRVPVGTPGSSECAQAAYTATSGNKLDTYTLPLLQNNALP